MTETENLPEKEEVKVLSNEELTEVCTELIAALFTLRINVQNLIDSLNTNSAVVMKHEAAISKLSLAHEEMDARLDVIKARIKGDIK